MIPKIIHYCWFGKGEMSDLALKCIASWKKYLPDYELKLWNEDNFDINSVIYVKEAYEAKKYADTASTVKITTNLGFIETERVKIIRGEVDFEKIINDHITRVKKKQNNIDALLASYQK